MKKKNFVVLMRMTEKGLNVGKNTPKWIRKAIEDFEKMEGAKLNGFYKVMGDNDFLALIEVDDDETALAFVMLLSSTGYVRTTTLKAFTLDQLDEAIDKIS